MKVRCYNCVVRTSTSYGTWTPKLKTFQTFLVLYERSWGSSVSSVWLHTGRPGIYAWYRQKIFSSSFCGQTRSEAHRASYAMGTGGPFPGVKRGRVVTLIANPHLVPRSIMSMSYNCSLPWRLHGDSGTASFLLLLFCLILDPPI
jgi:hypothetical protein